jgi:hypothetical protein
MLNNFLSPRKIIYALGAVAIVFGGVYFLALKSEKITKSGLPQIAVNPANTGDVKASANVAAQHNKLTKPKHSHSVSPELELVGSEYVEMSNSWFDKPKLAAAQQFVASNTPITVDKSCAKRAEMAYPTLENSIRNSLGIDTTQTVPLDALTQQVSQFWQQDGWYYQYSATWEKDIPATYTLEHYKTRQADFQSGVERIAVKSAGVIDALAMAAKIEEMTTDAEARGAKRGARLVHMLLGGTEGDSLQDLKLSNGKPLAWMFGYGHCRLRADGTAFCKCVDPATASKEEHDDHKVVD